MTKQSSGATFAFAFGGEPFVAALSGALYWPRHDALLVADLHLEKSSSFARAGQFLPPYDSHVTLAALTKDIEQFSPARVICLGDSFHDGEGASRLDGQAHEQLSSLIARQPWSWITGNHDPHAPEGLDGDAADHLTLEGKTGSFQLCHEPAMSYEPSMSNKPATSHGPAMSNKREDAAPPATLCGHLHPVARLSLRGRHLRRRAFVLGRDHLILPAYGALTGGLDLDHEAFTPLLDASSTMVVIGRQSLTLMPVGTR